MLLELVWPIDLPWRDGVLYLTINAADFRLSTDRTRVNPYQFLGHFLERLIYSSVTLHVDKRHRTLVQNGYIWRKLSATHRVWTPYFIPIDMCWWDIYLIIKIQFLELYMYFYQPANNFHLITPCLRKYNFGVYCVKLCIWVNCLVQPASAQRRSIFSWECPYHCKKF